MNKEKKEREKRKIKSGRELMVPALALVKQRESTEDGTYQLGA